MFQRKGGRLSRGEDRSRGGGRSTGPDGAGGRAPLQEGPLSPSRECWAEAERPAGSDGLPGFGGGGGGGALRDLEDAQLDQEEGVTQVTCM